MNWDDDSDKHERLADNINKLLGNVSTPHKLRRLLNICVGANLMIWLASLFISFEVYDAFNRVHEISD